ncbi:DUF4321 domain-containing protein [Desulfallas sp. Bu1-1]|uniref:DUF4321 domain-containing protein n=1 Tax=Desulfallas sp. Bu1-1 TaxID=2787620 RepID=UPI0018A0D6A0|nr:DUF4321 domain-containing protein [Desulfallas sp. Bu1-1]MBF7083721.1 DUF4321 domain-containing protein [Desulfallas sp. Bu1-1]
MTKAYRGAKSPWILLLLLVAGGLAGSALTATLAKTLPFLAATGKIGLHPATLDLQFLQVTFGFTLVLSPVTALGLILGYLVWCQVLKG